MKKNNSGFALVLSLILLLVMSLMGGALIVISSNDHNLNNASDEYQQTFYAAETGLLQAERYLIDKYLGDFNAQGIRVTSNRTLPSNSANNYTGTMSINTTQSNPGLPTGMNNACFNSFPEIDRTNFKVAVAQSWNFGKLFYNGNNPIFPTGSERTEVSTMLNKYWYQYFITQIGSAPYRGYGVSVAKGRTDAAEDGMAYRIYACGIYQPKKIVVPLETVVVLPK